MMNDYYVYLHRDPETNQIVYVGKGQGGRAWDSERRSNNNPGHKNCLFSWRKKGFLPCDWVEILHRNLTNGEAFAAEKKYIQTNFPLFNDTNHGEHHYKTSLTNEIVRQIYQLRKDGMAHKAIADKFGCSKAVVSQIVGRRQWKAVTSCLV